MLRCPKCKSTKLLYWQEVCTTEYYKPREDENYLDIKPIKENKEGILGPCGYECLKCNCKWSIITGEIIGEL